MSYNVLPRGVASGRQRRSSAAVVVVVLLAAVTTAVSGSPESGPISRAFDFFQVAERMKGCTPSPSEYEGKTISNLPCKDIVVDLPFELKFDSSQIGVPDRFGVSTGMRMYMPSTVKDEAYIEQPVVVQPKDNRLRVYGLNGNWEWDNKVRDALGVGLPVPNSAVKMQVTVEMPETDAESRERFCLFVAINDMEFAWTCILRQEDGYRVHLYSEKDDTRVPRTRTRVNGVQLGSDRTITLRLDILPADSEIKASYKLPGTKRVEFAAINVDPYLLNADQAGTDADLGSRTMGGFVGLRSPKRAKPKFFVTHFHVDELFPSQDTGTGEPKVDFSTWKVPDVKSPTSSVWAGDKLWVACVDGDVHMIEFNPARTRVTTQRTFQPIGMRMLTGITADPDFATNNCLWLSHSSKLSRSEGVANSGKVTKVCGPELDSVTDVIWGLPRAIANHGPNNLWFKGKWLYVALGGNTASGAPNLNLKAFLGRPEQRLSAAIVQFEVFKADFDGDCTPTQDPDEMDATGIAEKIDPTCGFDLYATGTRNVFDCTFHSNGELYCPDNSVASFGTFPLLPNGYAEGDECDGVVSGGDMKKNDPGSRHEPFYKIQQGMYYGHPNPSRYECVMGAGNPTNGDDSEVPLMPVADGETQVWDVKQYSEGLQPQTNFDEPIASFGKNHSPNGIIEYMSPRMCGKLQNQLLVTWFSVEPQIRRLELDAAGNIKDDGTLPRSDIATGGEALSSPLGIAQDEEGNLFVSEYGADAIVVFNPENLVCARRTVAANAPLQLDGAASAADGTRLYAFGGRSGARATTEAHVYDATSDMWTPLRDLPEALADASAVVTADGKVLIVGGEKADGTVSALVWAFDPMTGEYAARTSLPEARTGAVVALQQETPVVVGGLGQDVLPTTGTLRLGDSGEWEALADSRESRAYAAGAVGLDGKLLVCGGQVARGGARTLTQSCERFDGAQWSSAAPMGEARSHHAFFAHGSRFVAKGGYLEDGSISDSIEVLDPEAGKWANVGTMRTGRSGAVHGTLGGEMFTFSGQTESDATRRGDVVHIN